MLGLKGYLSLTRKAFAIGYDSNILKKNDSYKWHYFVKNLINNGDYVIDIGANLGYFSFLFQKLVGVNGHLYCVEPVAPFREQLEKFLQGKKNVTIYPYALGDEEKDEVMLGVPNEFQNLGYLRHGVTTLLHENETATEDKGFYFKSALKKGSQLFANIPRLDYIKCDIEGYETVVLPELKPLLVKHLPLIQVETWGIHLQPVYDFLTSINYTGYHLYDNKLKQLSTIPKENWGASDILFVPTEKLNKIESFL